MLRNSSISSLAPKKTCVWSWIVVGLISRMLSLPFVPIPPAISMMKDAGLHSYKSLSSPFGDALLFGYRNIPPYIKVRWKSAIKVPIYLGTQNVRQKPVRKPGVYILLYFLIYKKKDINYVFHILIWTLPLWNWVFVINLLFLNESFNPRIPGGKVRFIYRVLHESRLHLNIWSTKNEFSFIQKTKKKWVFSCILFIYIDHIDKKRRL